MYLMHYLSCLHVTRAVVMHKNCPHGYPPVLLLPAGEGGDGENDVGGDSRLIGMGSGGLDVGEDGGEGGGSP